MPARIGIPVHVFHFTGETLIKPGTEFVKAIRRCRGGNTGKFKAEFVRVMLDANGKRCHEFMLATRSPRGPTCHKGERCRVNAIEDCFAHCYCSHDLLQVDRNTILIILRLTGPLAKASP